MCHNTYRVTRRRLQIGHRLDHDLGTILDLLAAIVSWIIPHPLKTLGLLLEDLHLLFLVLLTVSVYHFYSYY